ncbi:MAG: hypothetical protein LBF37_01705, partial [Rickettsiales bacterium]|nr:hypothetical protein [Rickettsiales bacterium]
KGVQHSKSVKAATADLEKLSDAELITRFDRQFIKDCEQDKSKKPDSYVTETEQGVTQDISCTSLAANFHASKDKTADREAMLGYLTDATADDKQKMQTYNWIRMGESAGGAIAGVVSVSVINGVQKQLNEAAHKATRLQKAAFEFNKVAMQARLDGRSNNPMMEISGNCNQGSFASKMSNTAKKIKNAKTIQTVGVFASVGSAVTSGIQNVNSVGEKKGLNLASNITAGTAAVASGVGIAMAASSKKSISDAVNKLDSCMEYLWWDKNGHSCEGAGNSGQVGFECTRDANKELSQECKDLWDRRICPRGAETTDYGCAWCFNYNWNPNVQEWVNPGKTCEIKSCVSEFDLIQYGTHKHCMKKCTFQNGSGYQKWQNDFLLSCGEGMISGWQDDGRVSPGRVPDFLKCDNGYEMFALPSEEAGAKPLCLLADPNRLLFDSGLNYSNFCSRQNRDSCEKNYLAYTANQNLVLYDYVQDHKVCEKVTGSIQDAKRRMDELMNANMENNSGSGVFCKKKGSSNEYYVFAGNSSASSGRPLSGTPICKWQNNKCTSKSFLDWSNSQYNPENPYECISYCSGNY